jgi:hypothetical protein
LKFSFLEDGLLKIVLIGYKNFHVATTGYSSPKVQVTKIFDFIALPIAALFKAKIPSRFLYRGFPMTVDCPFTEKQKPPVDFSTGGFRFNRLHRATLPHLKVQYHHR